MAVYFVTKNINKFREAKRILDFEIKQYKFGVKEVQSLNIREIVEDKVMKGYEKLRKPVIVEDTALYIRSWNNFPGPLISWVIKTMGINGICRFVGKNRAAKAEACIGYYDGKVLKIFSGTIKGKIAKKPRGKIRFDWDRIFIPEGFARTFAEMSLEEKNKISHRMKAFKKLKTFINKC